MCFSLAWLQQILIYLVIIGAVYAILKLVIPLALQFFGAAGGVISQVINIVMMAFIIIIAIYICFALISCLLGGGGGLSLLPPHR